MTTYESPFLLIAGQRLIGSREKLEVRNPSTGDVIGTVPVADENDLALALKTSVIGFEKWRAVTPFERSRILKRAAQLLRERVKDLAPALTLEEGKTLRESQGELGATAEVIEWHAEEARRCYGRILPVTAAGGRGLIVREPVGPVAAFTPWNLPAFMPARKMAAALAAGCSCIIKPAEETPLAALKIAEIFLEAGLPPEALSVVYGHPAMISKRLVTAPEIRKVSFTGSVVVGREIARLASEDVKRVTMELGGHAPTIVFDDADIDNAALVTARSKFANAGQICVSPTRFYVHDRVHDQFVERVTKFANDLVVGDGMVDASTMGPMANERRIRTMERLTQDAVKHGAKLVAGGERIGSKGNYWAPTILTDVPTSAAIMNEEPFGPIVVTARFDNDQEVLRQANGLPFGLASFVFTSSESRAKNISSGLSAGLVGINTTMVALPESPFGGVKASGYGSEGGAEALDAFLTTKFIHQM